MSTTITTTPSRRKRKYTGDTLRAALYKKRPRMMLARRTAVPKSILPIRTRAIMKYNESIASPGTTLDYVYNLNSIFDPNRTGTGHQPYGYDTMATLYGRYRVLGVKYVIHFSVFSTSNGTYKATIVPSNDTTTYTVDTLAAETPGSISKPFSASFPCRMAGYLKPARVTGVSDIDYKDDRFQALIGASPSELIVLHIVTSAYNGTAIGAGVTGFDITLWYDVELFDRVSLAQS